MSRRDLPAPITHLDVLARLAPRFHAIAHDDRNWLTAEQVRNKEASRAGVLPPGLDGYGTSRPVDDILQHLKYVHAEPGLGRVWVYLYFVQVNAAGVPMRQLGVQVSYPGVQTQVDVNASREVVAVGFQPVLSLFFPHAEGLGMSVGVYPPIPVKIEDTKQVTAYTPAMWTFVTLHETRAAPEGLAPTPRDVRALG